MHLHAFNIDRFIRRFPHSDAVIIFHSLRSVKPHSRHRDGKTTFAPPRVPAGRNVNAAFGPFVDTAYDVRNLLAAPSPSRPVGRQRPAMTERRRVRMMEQFANPAPAAGRGERHAGQRHMHDGPSGSRSGGTKDSQYRLVRIGRESVVSI
jgi:hypothetical protein